MQNPQKYIPFALWLAFAFFARVIPHSPNFSPYASLILLLGCQLNRSQAMVVTILSLVLSDLVLSCIMGYPAFGSFSPFTYTGFIAMAAGSFLLHQRFTITRIACYALGSTLGYWLWTNFGTWILGGLYPHSMSGLMLCLIAGLPFLQSSLLSALVFVPLFCGILTAKNLKTLKL